MITTIDRIITALASEVAVAWAQPSSIAPKSTTRVTAAATSTARMLICPVPSLGNRVGDVGPQGQPATAHDDHEEDHEEGRGPVEPGDEVLVEEVGDVAAVERGHGLARRR